MARAFWVVVLLLLLAVVVAIPLAARARFEGFSVPSASMEPALLAGDYILVDKGVREADRGDLIVFSDVADPGQALVKRVIGLGGEEIFVQGRRVWVNCPPLADGCRPLEEPYAYFVGQSRAPERPDPYQVPAGTYFVMADNRDRGEDSRHWGPVAGDRILGQPMLIYWSRDAETGGIRWERLGRALR